tara:strand:- start:191 stop:1162 length:972 start_codon:yes stop_codon:yes gene_type:complete
MRPIHAWRCPNWDRKGETHIWSNEGDDEPLFKDKIKNAREDGSEELLKEMEHYEKNPITYTYNNYGFRCDDFIQDKEYNVFLGCSHTQGVGHYYENGFAYNLNKYLDDYAYANFGVGGSGIATGFRHLNQYKNIIKPKRVFVWYPHWYRIEIIGNPGTRHQGGVTFNPLNSENLQTLLGVSEKDNLVMRSSFSSPDYIYHYYLTNAFAIYTLCQELGAEMYFHCGLDLKTYRNEPKWTDMFFPRDWHGSTWVHSAAYNTFKEDVDNKNISTIEDIRTKVENRSDADPQLFDYTHTGKVQHWEEKLEKIQTSVGQGVKRKPSIH